MAIELHANRVLLDDYRARIVAARLGLNMTGILGVILVAKHRKLIPSVKPLIDDLIETANFRIAAPLYADILQVAGE